MWMVPDERRRAALLPWLFERSVRYGALCGHAWTTAGAVVGAAQWLPPGEPDLRVLNALRAGMHRVPLHARGALPRLMSYGRATGALRRHVSPERSWYLGGIAVDPDHQRRGVGAALLAPGLEQADAQRVACVLLTNTESNLSFYAAHGFEVVAEEHAPADGPFAWAMIREPRR